MVDVVVGALCALTFSVSPVLLPLYGVPFDRAVVLFEDAGVTLTEVESGADIAFEPMPTLMFPYDYGGYTAGPGLVYLRVVLPWRKRWTPVQRVNIRTNVVVHEIQHQLGLPDGVISPTVSGARPVVPAVPQICGVM
jgi:hypothetical protein